METRDSPGLAGEHVFDDCYKIRSGRRPGLRCCAFLQRQPHQDNLLGSYGALRLIKSGDDWVNIGFSEESPFRPDPTA